MTGAPRYARVAAIMGRAGWQRTAEHTARAGQLTGRGTSQQAALDDLSGQLSAMAGRALTEPAFWWDADNGCLHVVTPDPVTGGHFAYIVAMTPDGPYVSNGTSGGKAPVAEALATAVGMERVPRGRRPPPSPPAAPPRPADGKYWYLVYCDDIGPSWEGSDAPAAVTAWTLGVASGCEHVTLDAMRQPDKGLTEANPVG